MIEPTGYTALDLIGFTDRGGYDPDAYYVKNDIVTVGNTKWRCLIDDTHNITPTEGVNWTIYLESATSLAGMDDVDFNSPTDGDIVVYNGTSQKWGNSHDELSAIENVYGSKNLARTINATSTSNNITYTANADGTYTPSNATASGGNSWYNIWVSGTKIPAGSYYIGDASGEGWSDRHRNSIRLSDNTYITPNTVVTLTDSLQIEEWSIGVANGEPAEQRNFEPVIIDARIKDRTYASPTMTNRELTKNVTVQKLTATAHATNIDNFSSYLYKIGNLVVCSVGFHLSANSSVGTELFTLGTVPSEYSLSVLSPVGTAQKSMQIAIQTNGKVLANNAVNVDWFTGVFIYKA